MKCISQFTISIFDFKHKFFVVVISSAFHVSCNSTPGIFESTVVHAFIMISVSKLNLFIDIKHKLVFQVYFELSDLVFVIATYQWSLYENCNLIL